MTPIVGYSTIPPDFGSNLIPQNAIEERVMKGDRVKTGKKQSAETPFPKEELLPLPVASIQYLTLFKEELHQKKKINDSSVKKLALVLDVVFLHGVHTRIT